MRFIFLLALAFGMYSMAHAEFSFGKKRHFRDGLLDFDTVELLMDGKSAGVIYDYDKTRPIEFSNNYYVYAVCPVNKSNVPTGYCADWKIYDRSKKEASDLAMPGWTIESMPSFFWPYISFLKIPEDINKEEEGFEGFVKATCIVLKWPKMSVIAEKDVRLDPSEFNTETEGLFPPPKFSKRGNSVVVSCSDSVGATRVEVPIND